VIIAMIIFADTKTIKPRPKKLLSAAGSKLMQVSFITIISSFIHTRR